MLVCGRAFAATGEIEEIVVTAEKRASTVQSTAAAITAFSSDTIEQQHLYKPDQLQFSVPSMTYGMQSGYSFITLRGIGTDVTTLAAEPSVATYQDGVYTGALFTQDVPSYDLERIEVLRGPQGTLYGRNADGGVVNFITKPPSFQPEATASVQYGNYNAVQVDAGGSTALISDVVAGRFGFRYAKRDGYRDNQVNGYDPVDNYYGLSGRVAFLIKPNENLDITLRAAYGRNDNSQPYELITSYPVPPVTADTGDPIAGADPFGLVNLTGVPFGPLPLGIFSVPAALIPPGLLSPTDIAALNGGSIADYYGLNSQPGPIPPDPEKSLNTTTATQTKFDSTMKNTSATVEWTGDAATFRSITAYRYGKYSFSQDSTGGGTPAVVFNPGKQWSKQFTQEFNFFGSALDQKLDWLVGTYYFRENAQFTTTVWLPTTNDYTLAGLATTNPAYNPTDPNSYPLQLIPQAFFPYDFFQMPLGPGDELKTVLISGPDYFTYPPGTPAGGIRTGQVPATAFLGFTLDQTSTSAAGFAQLTYHITDALRLTGGLRYTQDDKDIQRSLHSNLIETFIQLGFAPAVAPDGTPALCDDQHLSKSWNAWTSTGVVEYDLSEQTMVYAKYSKGYKAGGYNPGECGEPFDPENVAAYEVGLKSTFWNDQIRTNLASYWYNYDNIQFTLYVPNQSYIRNAGKAEAYGGEVEFLARPNFLEGLQLDGSVSYEHSEYTQGVFRDVAGIYANGISIKGNELIRAPKWKFNVGVQYEFLIGNLGNLLLRVEESYTDTYYNEIFNDQAPLTSATTQPSYWLGNARLIWTSPSSQYEAQAFVENFTDEKWAMNRVSFNTPSALDTVAGQFGNPRIYGLRLTMHMGNF
jgi:iron complex outermembrane receptor protein